MATSRILRFKTASLALVTSGLLATSVAWAADNATQPVAPVGGPAAEAPAGQLDRADRHFDAERHARADHSGPDGRKGGKHGHGHKRPGPPALMIPGAGPVSERFVRELALAPEQTQHLDAARKAQADMFKAHRDIMEQGHTLRAQQLAAGKLDPRAILQAQDAARVKLQSGRQVAQDKWLALWDTLSADQQTKVAQYLQQRDERHARRSARHGEPRPMPEPDLPG